jgi:CHAT domain-containing protein/antitoxin component YwqK of YwqJK toxin-antitoxin module
MSYNYLFSLVIVLVSSCCQGQIPTNENITDAEGLRQGTWTILYDAEWELIEVADSAEFYRIISYLDDKPEGLVKDFFASGEIQWQATLLQDRPSEIYDGESIYFLKDGKVQSKRIYDNGSLVQTLQYNLDGSHAEISYEQLRNSFMESYKKAEYHEALILAQKAVQQCEAQFGKEHREYVIALNDLGGTYGKLELFAEAIENLDKALEGYRNLPKQEIENYLGCKKLMAEAYYGAGEFHKSLVAYDEIFSSIENEEVIDDGLRAGALAGLSIVHKALLNDDKALDFAIQASEIYLNIGGDRNLNYGRSLDLVSQAYHSLGSIDIAIDLTEESLQIRKEVLGEQCQEFAIGLSNLGTLYRAKSDFTKSHDLHFEALEILRSIFPEENATCATVEYMLALDCAALGELCNAVSHMVSVNEIRRTHLGANHPDHAKSLFELAILYEQMDSIHAAYELHASSIAVRENNLLRIMRFASEKMKQQNSRIVDLYLERFQSFVFLNKEEVPNSAETLFNKELMLKEIMLRYERAQKMTFGQMDGDDIELLNRIRQLEKTIYNLQLTVNRAELLDSNIVLKNELEGRLARSSDSYRKLKLYGNIDWRDVQQSLAHRHAAIEFIHVQQYSDGWQDSTFYAALILRKDAERPILIPLFEERDLASLLPDDAIRQYDYVNRLYGSRERGIRRTEMDSVPGLYELIWKPLESELEGVESICFAPSGLLHRVNFGAISVTSETAVIDKYELQRMNTTGSIVHPYAAQVIANDAALFGGIRYESNELSIADATESTSTEYPEEEIGHVSESELRGGTYWDYLPYSDNEVINASRLLDKAGWVTSLDTGYMATEDIFKFRSGGVDNPSPRLIHPSTHGFFLTDPEKIEASRLEDVPRFAVSDNPLMRSGLIMASANVVWRDNKPHPEDRDDGILTAYEIKQLDLRNTELVILSACETGLGDLDRNEGVFGLQRAFRVAGAQYLIMSLWEIDDRKSAKFVERFYENWLGEEMSIPEAFRSTQLFFHENGDDPYYWAGFVLVE